MFKFLVSCCRLEVQRLPGEEPDPPDRVVYWERHVAAYRRALERLLRRAEWDKEWYWGQLVVMEEGILAHAQEMLRLAQTARDGKSSRALLVRVLQLGREEDAMGQYRPRN